MTATEYDIAIIGAGIVGSSLASHLAPHARVLLLDRDLAVRGSSGHNPGFVGQLNRLPPLTELARRSVRAYSTVPGGFENSGCLEVALTKPELEMLRARGALARASGMKATLVSQAEARRLAPAFVEDCVGGLHFPDDGSADPKVLAKHYQAQAASAGATLLAADVLAFKEGAVETSEGVIKAKRVAVCTGIWGTQLLPLPMAGAVVVGQGYAYSSTRRPRTASPIIRWPGVQVYGRDHGDRDGIGSYDHAPVHVPTSDIGGHSTAASAWNKAFTGALARALALLPEQTAARFYGRTLAGTGTEDAAAAIIQAREAGRAHAFNSLFQVTSDGYPLVGRVQDGVYAI
ncbi:FAD dependent oxidoreductase [Cutaneotrichosporon oleaginosum]|uniref:FAD dependent oxidoreductase n=1 Tax=Cutaneotrichosporon oleaginosum TaxID=879819 RepID=A0A0J0XD44_9TREE|nr:FAD dependent oxidoreductase [Cutaneotrichosporon oleaginosum]KLT38995.1 FAD dependent oxidoreductase [Cutaneotrichosporon oleaginosum]